MRNRKSFLNALKYLFWYTVIFAVTAGGVFYLFYAYDKSFCWTTDAVSQYIPKAAHFISHTMESIEELLSGNLVIPMYDFNLGMGDGVQFHTEPLYWLYLLFGLESVEEGYNFLVLLRFYFAGLSMSAFLLYFKNGMWQSVLGSMIYIFCGFGLSGGLRHGHFIIPMITFPVMLLSIEEIYRKKNWVWCTITVAVSLLCGYYFTYMNTIGMGIYFLIRFFCGKEPKSFRSFWRMGWTIVGSYLLGVLLGNITLFNTFADYLSSSRTSGNAQAKGNMLRYAKDWGIEFFRSFITPGTYPGEWMWLGFIPLVYILIVLLFIRRGRKNLKTAFLLGILFGLVPFFGWVFSGFGDLTNRWCYMLAFVVGVIVAVMMKELFTLKKKEMFILFAAMIPYFALAVSDKVSGDSQSIYSLLAAALLGVSFLAVVVLNVWKRKPAFFNYAVITGLVIGSLWCSGVVRYGRSYGAMITEFTKAGQAVEAATDTPLKAAGEIEDDSFYRVSTKDNSSDYQGAAMILGYNGVVQYNSVLNKNIIDLYREMGLTSWSLVRLRGMDNRGYLDALAAVKYYCREKGEVSLPYGYEIVQEVEKDNKIYEVWENQNALPLGYTYDEAITFEELESYHSVERQEVMAQAVVLEEVPENMAADLTDIQTTGSKVEIQDIVCENAEITDTLLVTEKGGKITLYFESLPKSEVYICFEGMKMNKQGNTWLTFQYEDEKMRYCYHGDSSTYSTGQEDYIFSLGYHEGEITSCSITFNVASTIRFDELAVYCQPMENLDEYIAARKEAVLENIQVSTNTVKGTIELEDDKLLVLSIPYQNGWTAYVDGEETEILKANVMYMGLMLEAGQHEIELRYCMPGLQISLILWAAGVLILITALMIRRKRKNAV